PSNANGTAGSAFSETFTQTDAIGTTTFTLASGTLPAGLTLASNGVLSGTPTQTGSFPITVTVTDANGCTGTGSTYTIVIGCQTITVTNPSNANGTAGSAFSETFTQTGAIDTATFTLASGTLPAGLTLAANGVVSGTPTQTGSFPITVTVTDANGCTGTSGTYTIVIGCQTITVTNPSNATGPAGSAFSETFTQTGAIGTATFTLASGTLPAGLTLAANGVLSGTPTQGGSFPITVTVTDANGCTGTSATYTIVITCPTITVNNPANANGTAGSAFSETFTQTGGQGTITYTLASGTLPAGLTLAANGTLSGTPTQTGSFPITVTATDANGCTGTSATYTIVIGCQTITVTNPSNANGTANSAFSETFTQTGAIGTATFTLASGTLPAGLTLAANGVLSGTPTQTGSFPITVTVTDANGCTGTGGTYTIVIGCQTITVTNPSNTAGTLGAAFSETFTQSGAIGSATFTTASTLPSGLTLAANGVLSGTPTQTGSFPITVTVTDANGCTGTSATYTLVIACQTITVTNPSNANGTVGSVFSETFTQTGANGTATFTLASGTLPAGLTLAANGVLSGTPTQAGNFPITVTVTDSNGCTGTSGTYNLVIACQTITVNNPANANGTVGSPFSETFTQTGGIGTATFTLASGTLPAGLTLATNGVLSGTPTQSGSFPITVTATDSNGCTGTSSTYTLVIVCQTITVNNPANANGTVDAAFSETFTNTGAIGAVTYTLASGTLPSGLTLAPNGTLSGTPGQPGSFPITVTVTDVNGCTGTSATYTLVIACQTITVTNPATNTATYNVAFSQTFSQTGVGTHGPAVFTTSSTLPAGLTLASNGTLSGTPTQTGAFPIVVTVTDVNGCTGTGGTYTLSVAPVATNDSFSNGINNTQYVLTGGTTGTPSTPSVQVAGTIESNDFPSAATVSVTPGTFATTNGGSVTITADGTFLYTAPAQPGVAPLASDSFTYTVSSDTGATGTPVTSAPATVTINLANRVWYVKNDSAAGGNGSSQAPFDTLAEAQAASTANDIIYVYVGNGTNSGQNSGFVMKTGQKLYGQGIALVVNSQTLVTAGSRPLIGNSGGNGVTATNLSGIQVRGLNITGSAHGIDVTTSGANGGSSEIGDNTLRGSGGSGMQISHAGTGTYSASIHDNSLSGSAAAMAITRQATGGAFTITAFDDNVVPGTSNSGINVNGVTGLVTFDAGGGSPVVGGITTIGSAGDRTGTGLALVNVAGTLNFTDLDAFTDAGNALNVDGGVGGFTITVAAGVSTMDAINGAAVTLTDVTALNLQLGAMSSLNSAVEGVSLVNTTGTFSAPSGSTITNAALTAFNINGGTVNSTYNGTIYDNTGTIVAVANSTGGTKIFAGAIDDLDGTGDPIGGGSAGNGGGISLTNNTGATISFTGSLSLSTGSTAAFTATGGGTISSSNTASTITTTTGTALNVANTTIAAAGLKFTSVTQNGGTNGIVLATTGNTGGTINVSGTGVTGSGGTIQNTTGDAISLNNVHNASFNWMNITNAASGVSNIATCDLDTATGCEAAVDILGASSNITVNRFVIDHNDGGQIGIAANDVNGLTVTNTSILEVGNANEESGILLVNPQGVVNITDVTVDDPAEYGIRVYRTSGTLNLKLTRVLVQNNLAKTFGEAGFSIRADGGTSFVLVDDSDFLNTDGPGIDGQAINAAVLHMTVQNTIFQENRALPFAVNFTTDNTSQGFVKLTGNSSTDCVTPADCSIGFDFDANRTSSLHAVVANNTLNGSGIGSAMEFVVGDGATGRAEVRDNNFTVNGGEIGMTFHARSEGFGGTNGRMDVTFEGNTVNGVSSGGLFNPGVQFLAGSSTGSHDQDVCVNTSLANGAGGNTINGTNSPGLTPRFEVTQRTGTLFLLQGFAGTGTSEASVASYFDSNNNAGTLDPTFVRPAGATSIVSYAAGTCNTPTTPTLPTP
ncbi:MAG TPA: putative Ig domain-containing protein, partial [Thermoanaerobaculia bacterium]